LFYFGTKPTGLLVIGWHAQSEAGNRTVWDVPMAKEATRVPIIFSADLPLFFAPGDRLGVAFCPSAPEFLAATKVHPEPCWGGPRETLPQISEKIARKQRFMDTAANPA